MKLKYVSLPYFNSIKVRLKPYRSRRKARRWSFQFHKGTIKTLLLIVVGELDAKFQFHKGTIKTLTTCTKSPIFNSYFNSIKVRLKLLTAVSLALIQIFQFHKGTIKTHP